MNKQSEVCIEYEKIILREIKNKQCKRNDIAITYSLAIMEDRLEGGGCIDWKKINRAIISRWSKSGLIYIKEKAWKVLESMRAKSGV